LIKNQKSLGFFEAIFQPWPQQDLAVNGD